MRICSAGALAPETKASMTSWLCALLAMLPVLIFVACATSRPQASVPVRTVVSGRVHVVERIGDSGFNDRFYVYTNGSRRVDSGGSNTREFARNARGVFAILLHSIGSDTVEFHIGSRVYRSASPCGFATNNIALSPSGRYFACQGDAAVGYEILHLVGGVYEVFSSVKMGPPINTSREIAFVDDDKLYVAVVDSDCPFHTDRDWFTPARPIEIDIHGKVLGKGPCASDVVAGEGRVFYGRPNDDGQYLYSPDGMTWKQGVPQTVDGRGELLLTNDNRDLLTESGQLVAKNVVWATWSI